MLIGKLYILNIRPSQNKLKYRDLSENSLRKLAENLDHVDFSDVFKSKYTNEAYSLFLDTFLTEFDKCCPIKQVRKKKIFQGRNG